MTRQEKVDTLLRGLKRRVENLPEFELNRQNEIDKIDEMRKGIVARIEKYKDDEEIVKGLEASLEEFDKTYKKLANEHKADLEEAHKTLPHIKEMIRLIENNSIYLEHLELFIDIFLSNVLHDWLEYEEFLKESDKKETSDVS